MKRIVNSKMGFKDFIGRDHVSRIRGFVRVLLDGVLIRESKNMVVYTGREYVLPRIFYLTDSQGPPKLEYKDAIISHFVVGKQGSVISGGDPTIYPPTSEDSIAQITSTRAYQLHSSEIQPKYVTVNGVIGAGKWIQYVRQFDTTNPDNMLITTNNVTGRKTEVVLKCVVEPNEPYITDDYAKIDEAWLILGTWEDNAYHSASSTVTPVEVFAHVTFAPVWKPVATGTLTIEWHILS